jgi:hypothetical protein
MRFRRTALCCEIEGLYPTEKNSLTWRNGGPAIADLRQGQAEIRGPNGVRTTTLMIFLFSQVPQAGMISDQVDVKKKSESSEHPQDAGSANKT